MGSRIAVINPNQTQLGRDDARYCHPPQTMICPALPSLPPRQVSCDNAVGSRAGVVNMIAIPSQLDHRMIFLQQLKFPLKLHFVLEQAASQGFEHIISWLPDGKSFRVHDQAAFQQCIMPIYFPAMGVYKSFRRQLNLYGIHQQNEQQMMEETCGAPSDIRKYTRNVYSHPLLVRNNSSLCNGLKRVKTSKRKPKPPLAATQGKDGDSITSDGSKTAKNTNEENLTKPEDTNADPKKRAATASNNLLQIIPESGAERHPTGNEKGTDGFGASLGPKAMVPVGRPARTIVSNNDNSVTARCSLKSMKHSEFEPFPVEFISVPSKNLHHEDFMLESKNTSSLEQSVILSVTTHHMKASMDIKDEIIQTFRQGDRIVSLL